MRIDPKLITEFAAIAEEGSFTRAAQQLRVNQPWLSTRLRKLEQQLGFRVFERTTRRLSLTDRGAQLFQAARAAAKALEAVDQLATQLSRNSQGILRIGAAPYTKIIRQRGKLIHEFSLALPDVHLELDIGWSLALLGRLDAGELDLTFMVGDVDASRYESIEFRRFGVSITLSRGHPLAGSKGISPKELVNYPVQVFTRSLNPVVWDKLYAPLVDAGCRFVEVPEMAEGAPSRMASPTDVAAFFDFGDDELASAEVVHVPLAVPARLPFQLLRRQGSTNCAQQKFWELAAMHAAAWDEAG